MRFIFSETSPDYGTHLAPYQVWGVLEPGERPDDAFAQGFLPGMYDLSRFYLARSVRIVLADFVPNRGMRVVARHCAAITHRAIPAAEFAFDADWRAMADGYLSRRLGGVVSLERFVKFLGSALATHVLAFRDENGRPAGLVPVYIGADSAYYGLPVYELALLDKRLGRHLMATALTHFKDLGLSYGYLGTCYSVGAMYKARFRGMQFFNGHRWSPDYAELLFLIEHQDAMTRTHQLEYGPYLQAYAPEGVAALIRELTADGGMG